MQELNRKLNSTDKKRAQLVLKVLNKTQHWMLLNFDDMALSQLVCKYVHDVNSIDQDNVIENTINELSMFKRFIKNHKELITIDDGSIPGVIDRDINQHINDYRWLLNSQASLA